MSKMIQIRNVPDALHRRLKAKAAMSGRSLSDFLLIELRRIAEQLTREEFLERLSKREPAKLPPGVVVAALHDGREERDRELAAAHERAEERNRELARR